MRLTIIAPENVYEHEVDPSMEVRDVKALLEAEVRLDASVFHAHVVVWCARRFSDAFHRWRSCPHNRRQEFGGVWYLRCKLDAVPYLPVCVFVLANLTHSDARPLASSSSADAGEGVSLTSDSDFERMRLQALGDPRLMSQLRQVRISSREAR